MPHRLPSPTLRLRLSLMVSALLAIASCAAGVLIIRHSIGNMRAEIRSTMALTGHYLDAELDRIRDNRGLYFDPDAPVFQLNRLRQVRHLEIRYYDHEGRLMEISATTPPTGQVPSWFQWLVEALSTPMADVDRKIDLNGLPLGTLVMHPDPGFEIDRMWQLSRGLLGLLAALFVMINILIWWVMSRALRPIDRVLSALGEVERGNLEARLPTFRLPEIHRLSSGFNHMVDTLARSRSQNRRLTRRMIRLQEEERRYLARELHDEIGQYVTAIHADAAAIRNDSDGAAGVREGADAIIDAAGHIKELVRGLMHRLRPASLDRLGLDAALRDLVGSFRERHAGISVALEVEVDGRFDALDEERAITVFRAVQECLTNVARHAHARSVVLRLTHDGDACVLEAHDDGVGFDPDGAIGFGLSGMRERVRVLGGTCEIVSAPGQGTRIRIELGPGEEE